MTSNNQIPITAFTDLVCNAKMKPELPLCDGRIFTPVLKVKYYSGLLSNSQLVMMQIPLFKCVKCGSVHDVTIRPTQAHGGLTLNEFS